MSRVPSSASAWKSRSSERRQARSAPIQSVPAARPARRSGLGADPERHEQDDDEEEGEAEAGAAAGAEGEGELAGEDGADGAHAQAPARNGSAAAPASAAAGGARVSSRGGFEGERARGWR